MLLFNLFSFFIFIFKFSIFFFFFSNISFVLKYIGFFFFFELLQISIVFIDIFGFSLKFLFSCSNSLNRFCSKLYIFFCSYPASRVKNLVIFILFFLFNSFNIFCFFSSNFAFSSICLFITFSAKVIFSSSNLFNDSKFNSEYFEYAELFNGRSIFIFQIYFGGFSSIGGISSPLKDKNSSNIFLLIN